MLAAVRELGLDVRPNVSLAARAQGAGRLRRAALRGHRRRDQLGEVPRRRAARGRRVADGSWTAPRSRGSARASTRAGGSRAEPMRAHGRGDRRRWRMKPRAASAVAAIAAVGTAGLRMAPNCGRSWSTRCGRGLRGRGRDHPRRGGGSAGLPGGDRAELHVGSGSLVVFDTGGGSSQFTFGDAGRVDERFSVNVGAAALHGAVRPRQGRLRRDARRRARRTSPMDLARLDGAAPPDAGRRHGRRGHEPGRGQASGSATTTPTWCTGTVLDRRRDRPADRGCTASATPTRRRDDRRPPAAARRGDPRRRLPSCARSSPSSAATSFVGERPRAPPRAAARALRPSRGLSRSRRQRGASSSRRARPPGRLRDETA